MRFEVWAPHARAVEVELRDGRHPMTAGAGGWFNSDLEARSGDDYGFALDGGRRLPDPRSASQPEGVHGPSRVVDHSAFAWTDSAWRGIEHHAAIVYELHVGTFTAAGTFAAAVERLDHLVALGVNTVELMPVAEFAGARGWGYDGVDLYAPHHAYGGPDGLKTLVDACHSRGLAVVMDVVYNHLGPEGNYLAEYGPYFTEVYATPWGPAVNYDSAGSDAVREFVIENAVMWLRDYHCDGLRLDAVHAIVDTSAVTILEAIAARVGDLSRELGRPLWVVAESDLNDPRLVREVARGGYGLTAQWSDDFHHALQALLTGDTAGYYADFPATECVCTALRQAFVYTGQYSRYRQRSFGRAIGDLPLSRFLGYAQNHDQVGNRAAGERLSRLVSPARVRMASALTLLAPFVPLLFMGEEWAASTPFQFFTDFGDAGVSRAVTQGRRREFAAFGWERTLVPDPEEPETFRRCRLRWDEMNEADHAATLRWYRELIALRRATPGLCTGEVARVHARCDAASGLVVYTNAGLVVACNLGTEPAVVEEARDGERVLSSSESVGAELPPESVAVWRTR